MSADQPPYPPYPNNPGPPPQRPAAAPTGGFISALFDFSFTKFVTISFAQFVYILAVAGIAVLWLVFVLAAFMDSATTGILVLLFGWIPALIWLVFIRLGIEMAVAVVRTAANTGELVRLRQ